MWAAPQWPQHYTGNSGVDEYVTKFHRYLLQLLRGVRRTLRAPAYRAGTTKRSRDTHLDDYTAVAYTLNSQRTSHNGAVGAEPDGASDGQN